MNLPRILVGVTTYEGKDYIFHECVKCIQSFDYPQNLIDLVIVDNSKSLQYYGKLRRRGYKNVYHTNRFDNSRDALATSQNKIRQVFLEGKYDYLLMVESDLLPPPGTVKRLLSHDKRVVGVVYNIARDEKFIPCIFVDYVSPNGLGGTRPLGVHPQPDGRKTFNPNEVQEFLGRGAQRVHGCGLGCTLIAAEVVERFPFWVDPRFDDKHSDVYFYLDLLNAKIPVYVDSDFIVEHKPSDWTKVTDR